MGAYQVEGHQLVSIFLLEGKKQDNIIIEVYHYLLTRLSETNLKGLHAGDTPVS